MVQVLHISDPDGRGYRQECYKNHRMHEIKNMMFTDIKQFINKYKNIQPARLRIDPFYNVVDDFGWARLENAEYEERCVLRAYYFLQRACMEVSNY